MYISVADPGFPVGGGRGPHRRGCGLPRQLRFENFVCQNERIGTLGGGRAPGRAPLDPPMHLDKKLIRRLHWFSKLRTHYVFFSQEHE